MAVKASAEDTVYDQTDATAIREWHYPSTSAVAPARPSTTQASATPPGWSLSEPTVSSDADLAKYDYTCLQTVWGDGTCTWGEVTLSASFEAAKVAWNKASSAYAATQPIASKTYAGLIGSTNDAANASFYFAKVHPTAYAAAWMVKLRFAVTAPTAYSQIIDITICGDNSNFRSYDSFTQCNGSRGIYYINLYRATSAGISAGKGHALGIGLRGSTNPTTASAARTVRVDVLEAEGCTVSMLDTAVKYASMDGTGSTNYAGLTELNVAGNGQNATNNANTYNRLLYSQAVKARQQDSSHTGYVGTHIICGDIDGYINIAAGAKFDLSYPLLWYATAATTTIASGSTANNHYLRYESVSYTVNGTVQSGAAYKMVYLKGTVVGNTFTIAASPFMTTVVPTTEDGYCYIPLGSMTSATAGSFVSTSQLYAYRDGAFGPVSIREASAASKTATNYISTDSSGIKIANANPATATTYQHQTASATEYYVNGAKRSKVGGTGLEVFDGDSGEEESVATFGATQRIGRADDYHTVLTGSDFDLRDEDDNTKLRIDMGYQGPYDVPGSAISFCPGLVANSDARLFGNVDTTYEDAYVNLWTISNKAGRNEASLTAHSYGTNDLGEAAMIFMTAKSSSPNHEGFLALRPDYAECTIDRHITTIKGNLVKVYNRNSGVFEGVSLHQSDANNAGIYDNRNDRWIIYTNSSGQTHVHGAGRIDATTTANVTLADAKNYNNNSDNAPVCYKWGKCVSIRGIVSPKSQVAAGGTLNIGTIPSGYRPAKGMYAVCQGSGVNRWMLKAEAGGALTMERYGASANAACPTDAYLCITISYVIS